MENTPQQWDDYYNELNTNNYSIPTQSFFDFPTVNRALDKIMLEELDLFCEEGKTCGKKTILELGCGGANVSLDLARLKLVSKAVLVDFSKKIQRYLNLAINVEELTNVEFIHSDVLSFDYDEQFDIVHSGGLLDHFDGDDVNAVFRKHIQFCKIGGYVITIVPYNSRFMNYLKEMPNIPEFKLNYKLFEFDEPKTLFENNGLEIVYHDRAAISIRPHVANKRPWSERLQNLLFLFIHNIGLLWSIYRFLENKGLGNLVRPFFLFISDKILEIGKQHGDYLITIGRKISENKV